MRGQQPPSTVELPEPERHANFMVNCATHLDSDHRTAEQNLAPSTHPKTDHTTPTITGTGQHTPEKHNSVREWFEDARREFK